MSFIISKCEHILDPLKLEVGKEYNLNNVKEIIPTDDFLTLDRKIIGCQIEESSNDCKGSYQKVNAFLVRCRKHMENYPIRPPPHTNIWKIPYVFGFTF